MDASGPSTAEAEPLWIAVALMTTLDIAAALCRYKEHDGTSFNISYGFYTMFAYFKEWTGGSISRKTLDEVCEPRNYAMHHTRCSCHPDILLNAPLGRAYHATEW